MTASHPAPLPRFLSDVAFLWKEMTASLPRDPALPGVPTASVRVSYRVPVVLSWMGDTETPVEGTLSLRRTASGHVLGVELPRPVFGGLRSSVRRHAVSLDDVLDVRWEPGRWGGALVVTPMGEGRLDAFPGRPRGPVRLRVGRAERRQAAAFAHAVALADLPE